MIIEQQETIEKYKQYTQKDDVLAFPNFNIDGKTIVKIIHGHAGNGKTYQTILAIKEALKENPELKILIVSHSHKFLAELSRELDSLELKHLKGFSHLCARLKNGTHPNLKIEIMNRLRLSNGIKCDICKKIGGYPIDNCLFNNQFKFTDINIILAPIEYCATKYLNKINPDIIIVDDCMDRMKNTIKKKYVSKKKLETIYPNLEDKMKIFLKLYIEKENDYIIIGYLSRIKTIEDFFALRDTDFYNIISEFRSIQRTKIDDMKEYKGINKITEICKKYLLNIEIENFVTFRKYWLLYGTHFNQFARHYFYYLFDYLFEKKNGKMIIIDAIPNTTILDKIVSRYEYETKNKIDFVYHEISREEHNKTKTPTIYRCYNKITDWYPAKSSIVKNVFTRDNIKKRHQYILDEKYGGGIGLKIGLGIPKLLIPEKGLPESEIDRRNRWWTNQFLNSNLDVSFLTYGNNRGQNSIMDSDVYFVVGTYNINRDGLKEKYELIFAEKAPEDKPYQSKEGRWVYRHKLLEALRWQNEDYEQYQMLMRGRGYQDVFTHGIIPDCMPVYFKVESLQFQSKEYKTKKNKSPSEIIIKDVNEKWFIDFFKKENYTKLKLNFLIEEMIAKFGFSKRTAERRIEKLVDESHYFFSEIDYSDRYLQKIIRFVG